MCSKRNKTILIVEDEAIIAMSEKMELVKYGYSVLTVLRGEKAIEVIRSNSEIDLILMDIDLGKGLDGTQTAEIILKDRDIPIVFLSSHTEPEIVEKTEKITSCGYVLKGSSTTVLDASIKMAFKLFEANQKNIIIDANQKTMISNISDVISIVGKDGIMKYVSPNIEKWFGWQSKEIIGTDGLLRVHPKDLDRIKKEFYSFLKEDKPSIRVEYLYLCRDGSYKLIEMTATNLINNPAISGVLLNYHDITKRKHVEEKLRESENRFRLLFHNGYSANSLYEVIYDKEGKPCDYRYLEVNKVFEESVKMKASDLVGKTLLEVFPSTEKYWLEKIKEVVLTGNPICFENKSTELNAYIELSIYSPQKNQIAMASIDITKRKHAEVNLRKSEESLSVTLNSISDAIIITDNNGLISRMNPKAEKFCECSLAFAKTKTLREILTISNPIEPEIKEDPVKKVVADGQIMILQNYRVLIVKEGTEYQADIRITPIQTKEGVIRGVILIFLNLSENC